MTMDQVSPPPPRRCFRWMSKRRRKGVSRSQQAALSTHRELWKGGPSTCRGWQGLLAVASVSPTALGTCTRTASQEPKDQEVTPPVGAESGFSPTHAATRSQTRPWRRRSLAADRDLAVELFSARSCFPYNFLQQMTINECQGRSRPRHSLRTRQRGPTGWAHDQGWSSGDSVWTPPAGAPGTSAGDPTSETYTRGREHSASPGWTGFPPACLPHNQAVQPRRPDSLGCSCLTPSQVRRQGGF